TRDLDSLERALLDESAVEVVEPGNLRSALPAALQSIREHVDTIYVHLDLDVLASGVARANSYALSDGLTLEDTEYALSEIARVFRIGAVTLSAYDPAGDTSD